MKEQKITYVLLGVIALALCGCGKKATFMKPEHRWVECKKEGGEVKVVVQADGKFDATSNYEWIDVDRSDSTLTISLKPNEEENFREGSVILRSDSLVDSICVYQAYKASEISVAHGQERDTLYRKGGTAQFEIFSDGAQLDIKTPKGMKASVEMIRSKVRILTITAPENNGETINGNIELSCDDKVLKIGIVQLGDVCKTCNGNGFVNCEKCGGKGYFGSGSDDSYRVACTDCGGYGYNSSHKDYAQGTGKQTCPDCKGTGKP